MIIFNHAYIESYLLDEEELLSESFLYNERITKVFRLSKIVNTPNWVEQILYTRNCGFKFVLNFDVEPSFENLQWLIRISFLPHYRKEGSAISVFVPQKFAITVKSSLVEQGYDQAMLIDYEDLCPVSVGGVHGTALLNNGSTENFICINSLPFSLDKQKGLASILALILGSDIDLFNALTLSKNKERELVEENKLLSFELENHKTYLEIALKQKETEAILKFYHQEYEVLPLWYKRIGHLIKVLMGKRTLESLVK